MAFFNAHEKEDMQDDTYKLIAALLWHWVEVKDRRDLVGCYNVIENLYDLAHNRIKMEFLPELDRARQDVFGIDKQEGVLHKSKCIEDLRGLFRIITKSLDDSGILFKARVNTAEMIGRSAA